MDVFNDYNQDDVQKTIAESIVNNFEKTIISFTQKLNGAQYIDPNTGQQKTLNHVQFKTNDAILLGIAIMAVGLEAGEELLPYAFISPESAGAVLAVVGTIVGTGAVVAGAGAAYEGAKWGWGKHKQKSK